MKFNQHHALLAVAVAAGVALALPPTPAGAFAGDNVAATTDPGFVPNTGEINRGFDEKLPTSSKSRPIPTPAQARAAKMMPYPKQPSVGEQQAAETATMGAAPPDAAATPAAAGQGAESHGPLGATGQTMPSTISERNDVLDRVPIMAMPNSLSDQDRQQIYQAAMADKTPAATDAAQLAPAGELTSQQALNETHPMPASVRGIAGLQGLGYVKTKDKVFLVEPATRIVIDEIGS